MITHTAPETVVLVHGLWMNGLDMSLLGHRLSSYGYDVHQFSYHSLQYTPRHNAQVLNEFVADLNARIVHFVCHSLGGIVVRHLLHDFPEQPPGRVVTLGTPHKPSFTAARLAEIPFGQHLLGESMVDGLTGNAPPWKGTRDLGSIAGTLRMGFGMLVPGLPSPNDGTVSVTETRLDGMKDHLEINASHFGLLLSRHACEASHRFLLHGSFAEQPPDTAHIDV